MTSGIDLLALRCLCQLRNRPFSRGWGYGESGRAKERGESFVAPLFPHPSPPSRWPLYRHLSLLGLLTGTFSEGTLVKEVCLSCLPIKKRPNACHFVEMCSCYNIKVDGMLSKILVWLCCITDVIGMILLCVRQYFTSNEKLFSTLIKLFSVKRFP